MEQFGPGDNSGLCHTHLKRLHKAPELCDQPLVICWWHSGDDERREFVQQLCVFTKALCRNLTVAQFRVARAHAVARRHFPDSDDVAELVDLGRWLEAFHAHSWVELDLAGLGLAVQAADPSEPDRSLQDVQAAVEALREGRVEEAAERYRDVTVWWGSLALREHAN